MFCAVFFCTYDLLYEYELLHLSIFFSTLGSKFQCEVHFGLLGIPFSRWQCTVLIVDAQDTG